MSLNQQQDEPAEDLPIESGDAIDKSAARAQLHTLSLPETAESEIDDAPQGESPEGEPKTAQPDSEPGEIPKQAAKPKTLQELAEKLDMKVKDIFDIEFTDKGAGETRTIGELKDLLDKDSDFSRRELELSERTIAQENKTLQTNRELSIIMKGIPAELLDQTMLAEATAAVKAAAADEAEKVLEIIPSWNDETVRETELKAIAAHLGDYGFSRAELDRINDHRLVKFFRDSWIRADRVAKSLEEVEQIKTLPKGRAASKPVASKTVQVPRTKAEKASARQQLFSIKE